MDNNLNRSGDEVYVPVGERFEINMREEIPVNNLPMINATDAPNDVEEDIADSCDEISLDLSVESLKYTESVGEKFEECKRLTREGKLDDLYVAYGEFKQLTEELRDDTFEKEKYKVGLKLVNANIAVMIHQKADEVYKRNVIPQAIVSPANESSLLKVEMLKEYDFVIEKEEEGYSADAILWQSIAMLQTMNVDERLSELKCCWKQFQKFIANDTTLNSSESFAVETKKMDAVFKIFISQKAKADFVGKQLSGEIKIEKKHEKSTQFVHSKRNYLEEVINDFDEDYEEAN